MNIVIDESTLFEITVKWEPVECKNQNGKIIEYNIQYYEQDKENETITNATTMLGFTITDLQPLTVYVIRVAAVNSAGTGVYGDITAETKPCKLKLFSVSMSYLNVCVWLLSGLYLQYMHGSLYHAYIMMKT